SLDICHQLIPVEHLSISLEVDLLISEQTVELLPGQKCRNRLAVTPISEGEPMTDAHGEREGRPAFMLGRDKDVLVCDQTESRGGACFFRQFLEKRLGQVRGAEVVEKPSRQADKARAKRIALAPAVPLNEPEFLEGPKDREGLDFGDAYLATDLYEAHVGCPRPGKAKEYA